MNKDVIRYDLQTAGVTFEKRQNVLMGLRRMQDEGKYVDVVLVREPANPADKNAIKVIARWHGADKKLRRALVGYVPKDAAASLAGRMDEGSYVKITQFAFTRTKTVGLSLSLQV